MGRKSEEERRERRKKLIEFICKHQPVSGKDIYNKLYGGARSSFSDDMKAINRNGGIIVRGKGGYVISEKATEYGGAPEITQKLSSAAVRQWLILALLSAGKNEKARLSSNGYGAHGLTFGELLFLMQEARADAVAGSGCPGGKADLNGAKDAKQRNGNTGSLKAAEAGQENTVRGVSTLHNDLVELRKAGLVSSTGGNVPVYTTSAVTETGAERMKAYREEASRAALRVAGENENTNLAKSARVTVPGQREILDQINIFLGPENAAEENAPANGLIRAGKNTKFTRAQSDAAEKLRYLDYLKRAVSICYSPANPEKPKGNFLFYSGILVYSVETTRLYLLGFKDFPNEIQGESCILDVERIDFEQSRQTQELNTPLVRRHFLQMLPEMFSVSVEPAVDVRVRFENTAFVRKKLKRLEKARKCGEYPNLSYAADNTEIIYQDRIRGMEDFARYLRGFGRAAIAEEPESLAARMKTTYDRLSDLYN